LIYVKEKNKTEIHILTCETGFGKTTILQILSKFQDSQILKPKLIFNYKDFIF